MNLHRSLCVAWLACGVATGWTAAPPGTAPKVGAWKASAIPQVHAEDSLESLVRRAVWSPDEKVAARALARLRAEPDMTAATRMRFEDVEEILRRGGPIPAAAPPAELQVTLPDGRAIPVLVEAPPDYDPARRWPLMLAMHGGPPGSVEGAYRGARQMLEVWKRDAARGGWIVAAPAMTHVVAAGRRTAERLPYEVFRPEQARAVLSAVARRYRIDPNRVVSTGISLGSNFSIGFGAAMPDRLAAIVPVSTEGDSRELLLRNLQRVPVYVLEGSRDRNIRAIGGPRALARILAGFGYDLIYREFSDRAHEGFREHYADVLRWLAARPRPVYPREVLRVPHEGIMPPARRFYWVEPDTRQALVWARVTGPDRIEITARWAREIRLYLHDRLVDLDRPVQVSINGVSLPPRKLPRDVPFALEQVRRLDDGDRIYAASIRVTVPGTEASVAEGKRLWKSLRPSRPPGRLSFWEMYASGALRERFPSVGLAGTEVGGPGSGGGTSPPSGGAGGADLGLEGEAVAIRIDAVDPAGPFAGSGIRAGDLLLEVGGEPFFAGRGGLRSLHEWLLRELTARPRRYPVMVWRDGRRVELEGTLSLGSYREPLGN